MMLDASEAPDPLDMNPAQKMEAILSIPNLATEMDDKHLAEIGHDAVRDYKTDKESMSDWLGKMEKAIDLACLVKKDKTYPFEKAANVKYPLVASAALQFNARSYPAIVPSDNVVKCKVWGRDQTGAKALRAERVSSFMSWQLSCEVEEWEAETDKLLVQLPIVGDMFRKVWFDGERPRCKLVEPGRMIVNDKCQNIQMAPRVTEEYDLYPYQVQEREADGRFVSIEYPQADEDDQSPEMFIEQHTRLDLDEDGYPEPYIVTVHVETEKVVSVAADYTLDDVRFEMGQRQDVQMVDTEFGPQPQMVMVEVPVGVERIRRRSYFVHYQFQPGMDGGFWGTGLGILLGDISATINSTFNMLLDSGHRAALGGGFIGSEFRLKGGALRMRPGEWLKVQATGNDIRSAIVEQTIPQPSPVLFQMLGMLIEAGKEISSTKDVLTGETQHNMTATTTMALIEQGLKVFTAAYKRIFRSMKREYRLFAAINAQTLDPEKYNAFLDDAQEDEQGQLQPVMHDPAKDFGAADMDIQPVSDPNSVTKMQEMAKAQLLSEMSDAGKVDPAEATKRILEAASIGDAEKLTLKTDPAQQQLQEQMMMLQMKGAEADVTTKMVEIDLTLAKIEKLQAETASEVAEAERDDERLRLDAMKAALEERRNDLQTALAIGNQRMA